MWKKGCFSTIWLLFLAQFLTAQNIDTLKAEDILQMSLADLLNIKVVSASKIEQSQKDVAATIQVITSEQIRNRGYFTLDEALADLPGFQFRNINGFNSYVFMRGAPSQNNLILLMIDGIQVNELNSGGFYGGGQYNLQDIERIEVVYGPASALYGTNAVSGIINLITRKPESRSLTGSVLGGNFRTGMANFRLADYKESKDLGYSVSGQYKITEKADLRGEKGDNNWSDDMENFENDLTLSGRLNLKNFNAGIDYLEKKTSMTTNFKSTDDQHYDRATLWDIYFLNSYLKYYYTLPEKLTLNSSLYYRNSTVKPNTVYDIIKETDTTSGDEIGYFRPNFLAGIDNQLNIKPGDNFLLTAGLQAETEWLAEGFSVTHSNLQFVPPPQPDKPDMIQNYLLSYYGQVNFKLNSAISLNGGIRHDFSSYYGRVFIPRIGIIFNFDLLNIKVMYKEAFRAPKPWDYNYGTGNPNLKPEKMRSGELSFAYTPDEKFNIGGAFYLNDIRNKLTKETAPGIDRWVNKDRLHTTGFEIYANYISGNLAVYANYTYNGSLDQSGISIDEISVDCANAGINYSFSTKVSVDMRANYLGGRKNPFIIPATGDNKINEALIVNTAILYEISKKCSLRFKVNNLFNTEYYHPCNRFAGRYRQPQRSFLVAALIDIF